MQSQYMPESYHKLAAIEAPIDERMAFLRKVYGLLSLSVLTAAGASWMTLTNESFLMTVSRNYFLFLGLEIGAIFFAFWVRKKPNLGLIALFTFTVLTGITIAPVLGAYQAVVMDALVLTAIAFVGLSFYAVQSKKDFSFLGGMLTVGLIVLIVGGLLNLFFFKSAALDFGMACAGVLIFSGFILYDTQNILRNYPTDEYISATLSLYLDILNLFLMILRILGMSRD